MCSVFNVSAGRILCGFGDRLANWRLHLSGIGLRQYAIEIQVQRGLVHTVKILQVSKCDQLVVAEAMSLVGSQLRRSGGHTERHRYTHGEREPKMRV